MAPPAEHSGNNAIRAETLIAEIQRLGAVRCAACSQVLCGHAVLYSHLMGFRDAPQCAACLAVVARQPVAGLRAHLGTVVRHRDCYREAFEWTTDAEGPCRLAADLAAPGIPVAVAPASSAPSPPNPANEHYDAGDLGCGDLVLELRLRLRAMAPGQTLQLIALDPGAPEDIPAWCGLTGHRLLSSSHPNYVIQRKDN